MSTIYTIGHGAASTDLLAHLLEGAGVSILVDVRSRPYSRYHHQFNKAELRETLGSHAITYLWRGENLGGLGENRLFPETVAEVAEMATTGTVALMCSEKSPADCHRRTMLAPAFQAAGLTVVHLLHDGTSTTEPPAALPLF